MNSSILRLKKINLENILIFLIFTFPISLLLGSLIINISIILIDIFFIFILYRKKKFDFLNCTSFYLFLFFWLSLLINVTLSINFENSLSRSIGFVRFVFFIFAIKFIFNQNLVNRKNFFLTWFLIFLLVTFDIIFETFIGHNILGFSNNFHGRVSSFLNDELKIGNYYLGFILIALSFVYYSFKNKKYFLLFFLLFFLTALLIGERSNFLKTSVILFIFYFSIYKNSLLKHAVFAIISLSLVFIIISQQNNLKERFYNQIFINLSQHNFNLISFYKYTTYAAHHDAAFKIFRNYPIFGVGLKNFRAESPKDKYENLNFRFTESRASTHPHQIHFELLSETGLFGYLSFLVIFFLFLKRSIFTQYKTGNLYQLSGILFLSISLMPLIPTGSFFTTYGAAIFWFNVAIIESFND